MNAPDLQEEHLRQIIAGLQQTTGVAAVVLGGSQAQGTATPGSDTDLGIYYHPENPFAIEDIRDIAHRYAVEPPTVTGFYEWGPWVNGGAWISTPNGKVDFLYRNIRQVTDTIENARNGHWENNFEQQPPYGFSSLIYLAETETCQPLYDPQQLLPTLRRRLRPYPPVLKTAVVSQSLWAAEFTIWQAEQFAYKQDVYNTVGCLTRAVKNIIAALFAINEWYPLGDKRAIDRLEQAPLQPPRLREAVEEVLCVNKDALSSHTFRLKTLFGQTVQLAEGMYQPLYPLQEKH